jgi:hypothetical protein
LLCRALQRDDGNKGAVFDLWLQKIDVDPERSDTEIRIVGSTNYHGAKNMAIMRHFALDSSVPIRPRKCQATTLARKLKPRLAAENSSSSMTLTRIHCAVSWGLFS